MNPIKWWRSHKRRRQVVCATIFCLVVLALFKRLIPARFTLDSTTQLYFFSTIAQSSAGFAALVAVFAVFRLQANANTAKEDAQFVRYWLKYHVNMDHRKVDGMNDEIVQQTVDEIAEGKAYPNFKIEAQASLGILSHGHLP